MYKRHFIYLMHFSFHNVGWYEIAARNYIEPNGHRAEWESEKD